VISNPNWVTPPNGDDLADLYPERAQRMEVEGSAAIKCKVTVKGTMTECIVVSESPAGYGFGDQTIKASRRWKMKPATRDGQPVEGVVTVPLKWKLGG
jgi:protein TonB